MDPLHDLAGRLPDGAVTTDAEILRDRAIDSWALALLRRVRGDDLPVPAAVVFPARTEEVATVLARAGEARVDLVQDVFVELWAHPDRYDPVAGTLRTYLTMLARHRAVDLVRSQLRRLARQERTYRLTRRRPRPASATNCWPPRLPAWCGPRSSRCRPASARSSSWPTSRA